MTNAPYLLAKGAPAATRGRPTTASSDHMLMDGLEDAYETGRSMGDFRRSHRRGLFSSPAPTRTPTRWKRFTRARRAVEGRRVQGRDRADCCEGKSGRFVRSRMMSIRLKVDPCENSRLKTRILRQWHPSPPGRLLRPMPMAGRGR